MQQHDDNHSPITGRAHMLETTLLLVFVCIFTTFAVMRNNHTTPAASAIAYPIHASLN